MDAVSTVGPGAGEIVGDSPDRRVEILADADPLHATWSRFGPGREGAGLHVHHHHTDLFYVLDGELTVRMGIEDRHVAVGAGNLVRVPPLVVHGFRNGGSADVRYLNFHAPGCGFAGFMRGLRDGTGVGFDQDEPPADGGRPVTDAVIGEGDRVADEAGRRIDRLCDEPAIAISRVELAAWLRPGADRRRGLPVRPRGRCGRRRGRRARGVDRGQLGGGAGRGRDLARGPGGGALPGDPRAGGDMSPEFLLTSLVVVATPGTGVVYTLAAGLARGTRASLVAALGCTLGIVPHMLAAITGLAALLHASAVAFGVLKWAGVAYLLYLAWTMLRDEDTLAIDRDDTPASSRRIISTAVLINILNPKLTAFFFAFLPQFVEPGDPHEFLTMLQLSAVFMAITLVVFCAYGTFAAAFRRRLIARPRVVVWLRRAFAGSFIALGAKLALTRQ